MPLRNLMNSNNQQRLPSNIPKPKVIMGENNGDNINKNMTVKPTTKMTPRTMQKHAQETVMMKSMSSPESLAIKLPQVGDVDADDDGDCDENPEGAERPNFKRIIDAKSTNNTDNSYTDTSTSSPLQTPTTPADASPSIGTEAQIRFQKARIKALNVQLKEALMTKKDAEEGMRGAQKKSKEVTEENKRLSKVILDLKKEAEKMKKGVTDHSSENDGLKRELAQTKRDLAAANKVAASAEKEHKGREIRLARALEECEKFKAVLAKATQDTKAGGKDARKENDKLTSQIRSLERQRAELLTAFKKQVKLIDCLKKQKCHIEAAKLLSFTEEEFVKVLDWE